MFSTLGPASAAQPHRDDPLSACSQAPVGALLPADPPRQSGADREHGLPLSYDERTRAAARVIGSHPGWSDRAIAATVGLGARTVGNIRRRLQREENAGEAPVRTGRDGRTRPLNHAEGRLRASEIIRRRPDASLRAIAREAGVSPSTVRDVRLRIERGDDPLPAPRPRRPAGVAGAKAPEHAGPDPAAPPSGGPGGAPRRLSEPGRELLRWIFSGSVPADEWIGVVEMLPPHCTSVLAGLARRCAEEWWRLAEEIEEGGAQSAMGQRWRLDGGALPPGRPG
jgi:transposase